ncbi:MAG TPA: hypothetical protein VFA63_03620 [Pseudonocardiaceae bacterium]|nr:hypothetical protein [Pseudonocardiaceae bacterium]
MPTRGCGDPHSPWLLGTTPVAVVKGLWHARLRWLFVRNHTNPARFAPDLLADPDIRRINDTFLWWAVASLATPTGQRVDQLALVGRVA